MTQPDRLSALLAEYTELEGRLFGRGAADDKGLAAVGGHPRGPLR